MKFTEDTMQIMKETAMKVVEAYIHLASDGVNPWDYPYISLEDEYVLNPWEGNENPENLYEYEKMDKFYIDMFRYNGMKELTILNQPETPEGWLYIGDEKRRYVLGQPGTKNLVIVGLNPSTAKPGEPDPTIIRVLKVMEENECDGWIMINLYPAIETKPELLPKEADKYLVYTNRSMMELLFRNYHIENIYAAWGANIENHKFLRTECKAIAEIVGYDGWMARGITKSQHPRHPLYVSYEQKMEKFPMREYINSLK